MNHYTKKNEKSNIPTVILSALMIIASFSAVYIAFLSKASDISLKPNPTVLPVSSARTVNLISVPHPSEATITTNTAVNREVPLYLSDMPKEASAAKTADDSTSIQGLGTVSVYFHETGKTSEMPLEEYVLGALLAEMPTSYDAEALKAQAVACRTYAAYKALNCRPHESGGQLCTSSAHCQAFSEPSAVSPEREKTAREAVDSTRGIIMLYGNSPILAVFHAASVGSTRSSAEVWGGELPYLVPVKTSEDVFMQVTERRGHGVGMSQYGAQCLASEGYDFYAILSHYYTGVTFGYAK